MSTPADQYYQDPEELEMIRQFNALQDNLISPLQSSNSIVDQAEEDSSTASDIDTSSSSAEELETIQQVDESSLNISNNAAYCADSKKCCRDCGGSEELEMTRLCGVVAQRVRGRGGRTARSTEFN